VLVGAVAVTGTKSDGKLLSSRIVWSAKATDVKSMSTAAANGLNM
jgi:hypothetical protein